MSITDMGREAAEASSGSDSGGDEYEDLEPSDYRIDVSDKQFGRMHPGPTAVMGELSGLRYLPPAPGDNGEYDDDARGSTGFILENPRIPDDDELDAVAIFQSSEDEGDDYKIVNTDDESVDVYDVGVSVSQMFESEQVDEFEGDELIATMSSSAGRSAARTLDVKGLPNADVVRNDDWEPKIQDNGFPTDNGGLIEKHPDNDADTYIPPQYFRDPETRPDVEGQTVVLLVQKLAKIDPEYDGNAHWATVLADLDDDRQAELAQSYADDDYVDEDDPEAFLTEYDGTEMIRLRPTAEFEPSDECLRATSWMEWSWPDEEELEQLRAEQGVSVGN